jgi:hypothetical protein
MMGLFIPPLWLLAAALIVTGVVLVILGFRSSSGSPVEAAEAHDLSPVESRHGPG